MAKRVRPFVIPAYLLLCLLLGGSAQGVWRNMILQLVAVALIAWAALSIRKEPLTPPSMAVVAFAAAGVLLVVVQLIPIPPDFWTRLPGRDFIASGYARLGYELPWLPISLTPYETLATSLSLLPPIGVVLGIIALDGYEERWIAAAILIGTFLHVLLGAVQSVGGGSPDAWWNLYDITNPGAVGFFANRNHMGTLLVIAIPFATLVLARAGRSHGQERHSTIILGTSGLLLVVVGLALNQSLAAIVLAVPVIALSALLLPHGWGARRLIFSAAALIGILAVLALTSSPVRSELEGSDTTSFEIRSHIWDLTWSGIERTFPAGTGIGSFEQIYRMYEDPSMVEHTYVNHAHNDYLELTLEGGVLGLLLIVAFLAWWSFSVAKIWRSRLSRASVKAATIASGAILAHSFVDYPLRTAAIAAVFGACVGLIAQSSRQSRERDLPHSNLPKHLVIG